MTMTTSRCTVRALTPTEAEAALPALCEILIDSVEGGAAVSFIVPMTMEKALPFWKSALASHARGERVLLVAEMDGRIEGTVQVVFAPQENQDYRSDIAKMLVHSRARRQGIGEALLRAAEDCSRDHGRNLIVLDTQTDGPGDRLYSRCGWIKFGEIPDFAWNASGKFREAASFYYKVVG